MAELATAGSVVGLISLCISCCEGLTKYYSDFKSYSDELNYLVASIDELRILCQNVEQALQGRAQLQEPTTQQIARIIDQFRNNINRLDDALSKCQRATLSNDFATRLASLRAEAIYPFKKRTLQTLKTNVDDAHVNLTSALQILQIQISSGIERKCQENQISIQELSLPLRSIDDNVAVLKQQNENQTRQVADVDRNIELLHEDVSALNRKSLEGFEMVSAAVQNISPNIEIALIERLNRDGVQSKIALAEERRHRIDNTAQIKALGDDIKEVLGFLVSKPSLLKSVCDTQSSLNESPNPKRGTLNSAQGTRYNRIIDQRNCTCQRSSIQKQDSTSLTFGMVPTSRLCFKIEHQSFRHDKLCPLYTYTTSIKCSGNLLAFAIRASFCLSRGAGALLFNRSLETARLVSNQHPAFQLVRSRWKLDYGTTFASLNELGTFLGNQLRNLEVMFQNGTASPYDVDCEGRTLLQAFYNWNWADIGHLPYETQKTQELTFWYHRKLVELGVPLNWPDLFNFTLLDHLIYDNKGPHSIDLSNGITQLLDDGAQLCVWAQPRLTHDYAQAVHWNKNHPHILEVLCYEELSVVVLTKSEDELLRVLSKNPASVNQTNRWGQTPLHLAVSWPLGVNILVQNGANVDSVDGHGDTPLNYALRFCFTDTVQYLLEVGCGLNSIGDILFYATGDAEAKWIPFISSLAKRRHKLYDTLVVAQIPEKFDACWARDDRLLDEYAATAEDILKFRNVPLSQPSTLVTPYRTLYHAMDLRTQIAEQLWHAKFRDIDVLDDDGHTPLTTSRFLLYKDEMELVSWLIEKGADIRRPIPRSNSLSKRALGVSHANGGRRAVHFLAQRIAHLGESIYNGYEIRWRCLEERTNYPISYSNPGMKSIFSDQSRDDCICACSKGGCRPSKIFLRQSAFVYTRVAWSKPSLSNSLRRIFLCTQGLFMYLQTDDTREDWLAKDIIRFNTFWALQLRHTCCDYGFHGLIELDSEEVDEIRDEDSQGIELLEQLMLEFQEKLGDQSLMTFLKEYWTTRMREVLRARGKVNLKETREIGVVWDDNDSEENSGDED